jgi:hypothetical protein
MKTWQLRFAALAAVAALFGGAVAGVLADCGPFTDVGAGPPNFCPFILELYYLGITAGTSPTTFSPNDPVTRAQMAVFIAKSLDQSLLRSSRRAALGQWWTPQGAGVLGRTSVPANPRSIASDGADLWVAHHFPSHVVTRIRASDGRLLDTWTGATRAIAVAVAMGRVIVAGNTNPGTLYMIDPTQPPGAVSTVADALGAFPVSLAFDGARFWTANSDTVSIVTPGPAAPWSVTTVEGFTSLQGIVFDGAYVWVADSTGFKKLDSEGAVLQTISMGNAGFPVFDGANIWVPDNDAVQVIRASTGATVATLIGNGLTVGEAAAFDGQRILVTNRDGESVSLWKAADLTPLGAVATGLGSTPRNACSDGINFWIALDAGSLVRF